MMVLVVLVMLEIRTCYYDRIGMFEVTTHMISILNISSSADSDPGPSYYTVYRHAGYLTLG